MVEISIYIYRKNHNNLHFRFSLKHLIIYKKRSAKKFGTCSFLDRQAIIYISMNNGAKLQLLLLLNWIAPVKTLCLIREKKTTNSHLFFVRKIRTKQYIRFRVF